MREPRLALLGADGQLEQVSASVDCQEALLALASDPGPELGRLLRGEVASASLTVAEVPASAEIVLDASGARHTLIALRDDADERTDPVAALLAADLDASPAVVFVKDLDGRYLRVNPAHSALLGGDELIGRRDEELPAGATVDGPRQTTPHEPAQLEYIVPVFEARPALTVLRFLVRDLAGDPLAVCGVAAPTGDAALARREAERLMHAQEIREGDARAAVLNRWGVARAADLADEADLEGSVVAACAGASLAAPENPSAEAVERLEREVRELGARLDSAQAEARAGSVQTERSEASEAREPDLKTAESSEALAADRSRTDELVRTVARVHERLEDLAGAVSAEQAQRGVEVQTLRRELETLRRELEGAQATLDMVAARSGERPGSAAGNRDDRAAEAGAVRADRSGRGEATGHADACRGHEEPPSPRAPEQHSDPDVPSEAAVDAFRGAAAALSREQSHRPDAGSPRAAPAGSASSATLAGSASSLLPVGSPTSATPEPPPGGALRESAPRHAGPPAAEDPDVESSAPARRPHALALSLRRLGRRPGAS